MYVTPARSKYVEDTEVKISGQRDMAVCNNSRQKTTEFKIWITIYTQTNKKSAIKDNTMKHA
jgi:hypothetical protein